MEFSAEQIAAMFGGFIPPAEHPFPGHIENARTIAADGMVLLKNENHTLPVKAQKVALFGAGAVDTIACGTGSGYVTAPMVNVQQGLENAGFTITSTAWLDRFSAESKRVNDADTTLSQLDRFFVRLTLGYPDHSSATEILKGNSFEAIDTVNRVMDAGTIISYQEQAADVHASDEICDYVVSLSEATRNTDMLIQGVSPRGSIAVLKLARAYACYEGRDFVIPEDIHKVIRPVCNHRIILSTKAKAAGRSAEDIIADILDFVPVPLL